MPVSPLVIRALLTSGVLGWMPPPTLAATGASESTSQQRSTKTLVYVQAAAVDEAKLKRELALRLRHVDVQAWTKGTAAPDPSELSRSIWVVVATDTKTNTTNIQVIAGDGRIYRRQLSTPTTAVATTLARDLSSLLLAIENRTLAPESTTTNVLREVEKRAVLQSQAA